MKIANPVLHSSTTSIIAGFAALFAVYHSHEFFQSMAVSAVAMLSFVVVSYAVARAQKLEGLQSWGLGLQQQWWAKLLTGMVLGSCFVGLSTGVSIYLGYERITETPGAEVFFDKIWWIMFMTFWPSLAEDILTRGYLFKHLSKRMPANAWVLFSAVVYVLNHIWRLADHPSVLTYLFILGLVLATAMQLTKSLWLTLGIHWASNIVYYITVDIFPTESVVVGYQSTWILAASYFVLLCALLSFGAIRKKANHYTHNPATEVA
ncbi:CPBP family intramembrane glutamic endopeptidase [Pontibacter cellulosilyticus]|uniref:CPBP family intramembrane metalloprotease n=1 Tax=Pontibacter cellulosilyticus TaxID=1720253 RepID=A0A923SJS4_9BACT|nr:type II CAAX endopeptidase family protein [Pontibacter cellulosilyticus]MBC5993056.1 CPBP family intramembrane metalloprotease [Pontibacter cellulosilyticus]